MKISHLSNKQKILLFFDYSLHFFLFLNNYSFISPSSNNCYFFKKFNVFVFFLIENQNNNTVKNVPNPLLKIVLIHKISFSFRLPPLS